MNPLDQTIANYNAALEAHTLATCKTIDIVRGVLENDRLLAEKMIEVVAELRQGIERLQERLEAT